MEKISEKEMVNLANKARLLTAKMFGESGQGGHIGGSFSAAEIITVLYNGIMKIDPKNPEWELRDHFILSKGHISGMLPSVLQLRGFFGEELLNTYDELESAFGMHTTTHIPGCEFSAGSLGLGGNEGVKNLGEIFGGDTFAGIRYFDDDLLSLYTGGDGKLTSIGHGLSSIVEQMVKHLREEPLITGKGNLVWWQFQGNPNIFSFFLLLPFRHCSLYQAFQLHLFEFRFAHFGERLHIANHLLQPGNLCQNDLHVFICRILGR